MSRIADLGTLTLDKAHELLDAAVAEKGADYIYSNPKYSNPFYAGPACAYIHSDEDEGTEPGCIVGNVLNRFGVSMDMLAMVEGLTAQYAIRNLGLSFESGVDELLDEVQFEQDVGKPWGEAVLRGRERFPYRG